jgi:hypothetical protein
VHYNSIETRTLTQKGRKGSGHRLFQVLRRKQEGAESETKLLEEKLEFKIY